MSASVPYLIGTNYAHARFLEHIYIYIDMGELGLILDLWLMILLVLSEYEWVIGVKFGCWEAMLHW